MRAANRKSVRRISEEIHTAQHYDGGDDRRYRGTMAFLMLPRFLRALAWWGIPIAPPTLMVTVGGISTQPRLIDGELCNREFLSVTLSFDHDVVDG